MLCGIWFHPFAGPCQSKCTMLAERGGSAREAAKAIQLAPEVQRPATDTQEAVEAFLAECEGRLRPATVRQYWYVSDRGGHPGGE